jgi:hypothetical protein
MVLMDKRRGVKWRESSQEVNNRSFFAASMIIVDLISFILFFLSLRSLGRRESRMDRAIFFKFSFAFRKPGVRILPQAPNYVVLGFLPFHSDLQDYGTQRCPVLAV